MTTQTLTLTDFLLARIAEDEAVARMAGVGVWKVLCSFDGDHVSESERVLHLVGCSHAEECVVEGADMHIYDEGGHDGAQARHIARHDPGRVLAECAAKRAILEMADEATGLDMQVDNDRRTDTRDLGSEPYLGDRMLKTLASVYADHPDFDPAWS